MNEPIRTVVEAAVVGVALFLVAWAANGAYSDGLDLSKDYFLEASPTPAPDPGRAGAGAEPTPGTSGDPASTAIPGAGSAAVESPEVIEQRVTARLEEAGLQVIPHDAVVELYRDPIYADGAFVFVDARNDAHFASGHIPGAYQFDHFRMERYVNEVVPAAKGAIQVVVYCYGMDCTDSEIAAKHLSNFGIDPSMLFVYVGGIQRWCKAGQEVETGPRGSGKIGKCAE